jgi:hypothetical protein
LLNKFIGVTALELPPAKRVATGLDFDRIFNAMPHELNIKKPNGTMFTVPKQDAVLRLTEAPAQVLQGDPVDVIAPPVYTGVELTTKGAPADLSTIPPGAHLLVSALVGEYVRTNGLPAALASCLVFPRRRAPRMPCARPPAASSAPRRSCVTCNVNLCADPRQDARPALRGSARRRRFKLVIQLPSQTLRYVPMADRVFQSRNGTG